MKSSHFPRCACDPRRATNSKTTSSIKVIKSPPPPPRYFGGPMGTPHPEPAKHFPSSSSVTSVGACSIRQPDPRSTVSALAPSVETREISKWIDEFTKIYDKEIERDPNLPQNVKMVKLNHIYRCWILDLYEQVDRLGEVVMQFESALLKDKEEYDNSISKLQKVNESQSLQLVRNTDAIAYLEQEHAFQESHIKELTAKLGQFEALLRESKEKVKKQEREEEKKVVAVEVEEQGVNTDVDPVVKMTEHDLRTLIRLVQVLRDHKIWHLQDTLSRRTYEKLFKGHEDIMGKRYLFEEEVLLRGTCPSPAKTSGRDASGSGEGAKMAVLLEQYKAKIFVKEKRLEKLSLEEAEVQTRIQLAKARCTELEGRNREMEQKQAIINNSRYTPRTSTPINKESDSIMDDNRNNNLVVKEIKKTVSKMQDKVGTGAGKVVKYQHSMRPSSATSRIDGKLKGRQ